MSGAKRKQTSRWRKPAFALLATVLVLLVLEGVAWLIDLGVGFHATVARVLEQVAPLDGPIPPQETLSWPEGVLQVRSALGETPRPRPYMLGGKTVPGADHLAATMEYTAAEAREDPRRKVFVVGGSAAFGFPYSYRDSFPALLQERLGHRGFLVVNAARVGWASGHLVPLVDRVIDDFSPDVLVLFLGNNEWLRFTPKNESGVSPSVMALYRRLSFSRLATLAFYWRVKSWEERQEKGGGGEGEFVTHGEPTGYEYALRHLAIDFDAEAWEEARAAFLDNYEGNLRTMVSKARKSGVRVILGTMPFLHKLSPAWKHRQPLVYDAANLARVTALLEQAIECLQKWDGAGAIAALDQALALEPKSPLLRYVKAYALEQNGMPEEAERWYGRARDAVVGNLGGVLTINEIIRKVAREEGAILADFQIAFERRQHALGGYFNRDLIADDCHPSRDGQRLIAELLERRIE